MAWSRATFKTFAAEVGTVPGVSMVRMVELLRERPPRPWWHEAVESWETVDAPLLPAGYAAGFATSVPLVESGQYLNYLHQKLTDIGVAQQIGFLKSFSELDADVVVNCTGLGARRLCSDDAMYPIRGVVVRTERVPLYESYADDSDISRLTYVIPRTADCILGGFAQRDDNATIVRDGEADDIRRRCAALVPELANARPLEVKVGLRPGRETVRLAWDSEDPRLIHNYGHGGSGFTVCWGCADEVASMVGECLPDR